MKKQAMILGLTLALCITGSSSWLPAYTVAESHHQPEQESNTDQEIQAERITLTSERAYDLALENDIELQKLHISLEEAKRELKAVKDIEEMELSDLLQIQRANGPSNVNTNAEVRMQKYIIPEQLRHAVELAEMSIESRKLALKGEVEAAYFSVLEAQENLSLTEEQEMRAKKVASTAELRYEKGLIAKSEQLDQEVMVEQAQAGVLAARTALELAQLDLQHLIGLEQDHVQYSKVDHLELPSLPELDELMDLAFKSRADLISAQLTLESEENKREIYDSLYMLNMSEEQSMVVEKATLDVKKSKTDIESQVTKAYKSYLSAQSQLPILELSIDKAKQSLDIAEIRYENGQGTSIEVLSAQLSLKEAEINLLQAKYDLFQSFSQLENVVGSSILRDAAE